MEQKKTMNMRPIDYFLLFDSGVKRLREALKVEELLPVLEAIEMMGYAASQILVRNLNIVLEKYFTNQAKEAKASERKELFKDSNTFKILAVLTNFNSSNIITIGNLYMGYSLQISMAINGLTLLEKGKNNDEFFISKEFSELRTEMNNKEFVNTMEDICEEIETITAGINIVYQDVYDVMQKFTPDSFFLKQEIEIINAN